MLGRILRAVQDQAKQSKVPDVVAELAERIDSIQEELGIHMELLRAHEDQMNVEMRSNRGAKGSSQVETRLLAKITKQEQDRASVSAQTRVSC